MAKEKPPKKSSGSTTGFVLMVGDEGAILVQMQKKRVVRRLFAQSPDPAHVRAFEEALMSAPRAPITLIIDMMDQSYVRQTLPPVSSLSVGKIVRRRLDKDFSRDDIKGYLILDREKTGRRDWNYLMVSLANPPLLQKWISFVVERSNPFRGMGLVPLESQAFMVAIARSFLKDKKEKPLEWQILVSHHKVGGFRQVVLNKGKLVFTRMAQPIGESSPEVIAGNIEQEMINTQEYLKRMGLQDTLSLSVVIIASEDIKGALDPKNIKASEYHFLTPHEMANLLTLPDAAQPGDHFGDVVISAFAGRKRKLLLPLNTPYTTRLRKISTYIKMLRCVAALMVLCIIGWMGMTGWDIYTAKTETGDILDQQKVLRKQLDSIKVEAKSLPKQMDTFNDVMALTRVVSKRRFDTLVFIVTLLQSLQESALVKEYHWTVNDPVSISKDGDKRQIQADLSIEMITPLQPRDQFIIATQSLMTTLQKNFPEFDVNHSELPGLLSDTKELKTVLDDNGNASQAGDPGIVSDIIKINIKGPKDPAKNGH